MDEFQKPRHIRDIAHLFISRTAAKDAAPARRVLVVALSRECFGAYHAANLALGFGRKDYAVELMEVSGVLPCSAYFLRLPPRVYIRHKVRSPHEALSALGSVSIRFSLPGDRQNADPPTAGIEVGPKRRSAGVVEVYHVPPVCDVDSLDRVLEETIDRRGIAATSGGRGGLSFKAVVLASKESEARKAATRLFQNRSAVDWSTLSLDDRFGGSVGSSSSRRSLGYLAGWRSLLSDPLPCVVRDPGSHVSRSYLSVCDALLSAGSSDEERHVKRRSQRAASLGQFR